MGSCLGDYLEAAQAVLGPEYDRVEITNEMVTTLTTTPATACALMATSEADAVELAVELLSIMQFKMPAFRGYGIRYPGDPK